MCVASIIRNSLAAWDGKSTDYLTQLYNRYTGASLQQVLKIAASLITTVELQTAATWLLKHAGGTSCALIAPHSTRILTALPHISTWEAQLHILQMLHCLSITPEQRRPLEYFIRECIVSNNKFVRAWAYNGFGILARTFPQYIAERDQRYEYGLKHEAASVRARIRHAQRDR